MPNTISIIARNAGKEMHLYLRCHHMRKNANIISFVPLKSNSFFLFYQKTGIKSNRIYVAQASTSNYYNNISFVELFFKAVGANRHLRGTNR